MFTLLMSLLNPSPAPLREPLNHDQSIVLEEGQYATIVQIEGRWCVIASGNLTGGGR